MGLLDDAVGKYEEGKKWVAGKYEEAKNWTYAHAPESLKQAINYVIPNNASVADSGSNTDNEAASPPPPRVLTPAEQAAEWNGSYNNLITEISNCPSVEARSALVKEHQEELIRFKDSNLPVDDHLKYLCVTMQGEILPNKNGQLLTGEAAWNYNYNDLIGKIANCKSMDERSELATKYQEELVKYKESGLAVDNDLAYLNIALGTDGKVSKIKTDTELFVDNAKNWLNDTKPVLPYEISQGDDLISKKASAATGSITEALSKIEKKENISAYTNERGTYQAYPNGGLTRTTNPLGILEKTGKVVSVGTTVADVANTWTTDDGNTNLQRIEKTGIQVAGSVFSYGLGGLSTSAILTAGLVGAPETGGVSVPVAVLAAGTVDYQIAQGVDYAQNAIYDKLGIKHKDDNKSKEGKQTSFDCDTYLDNYSKMSDSVEQSMGLKFGTNQQSRGVRV